MAWVETPSTSWTPTVTQSGSVTVTVSYAKYSIVGNVAVVRARLAVTGSGTIGNTIVIAGIPAAIASIDTDTYAVIGTGFIANTTAGTIHYHGALVAQGANDWRIITDGSNSYLGINPSFALASGHTIALQAAYFIV